MSSISDIFFGSKQNLLENYLLHRQSTPITTITATYTIGLGLTLIKPSRGVCLVKAQFGVHQLQQYFTVEKKSKQRVNLFFESITNIYIQSHSSIKIQLQCQHRKVVGYIPVEVLKDVMKKVDTGNTGSHRIEVNVKGNGKNIMLEQLLCEVIVENHGNRVLDSGLMDQTVSEKYTGKPSFSIQEPSSLSINRTTPFTPATFIIDDAQVFGHQQPLVLSLQSRKYEVGDTITIAEFRGKPIVLDVHAADTWVGSVSINPLLLVEKCTGGRFPIDNTSHQCVGIITLSTITHKPTPTLLIEATQNEQLQSTKTVSCLIIHNSTILLRKNSISEWTCTHKPTLLIRAGQQIFSTSKQCIPAEQGMWCITIAEPITVLTEGRVEDVEIEVYEDGELIGYCKVKVPNRQGISYWHKLVNMSNSHYTLNGFIQLVGMEQQKEYLLGESYGRVATAIVDDTLEWGKGQITSKQILEKYSHLNYVECTRVTQMMGETIPTVLKVCLGSFQYQLLSEMVYLDHEKVGTVQYQHVEPLKSYYKQMEFEPWCQDDKVFYLFPLMSATITYTHQKLKNPPQQRQQQKEHNLQKRRISPEQHVSTIYIQHIQCTNMHKLMKNQQIPSIKLSTTGQTLHRNANPIFKIFRHVPIGTILTFSHNSVKLNTQLSLCSVELKGGGKVKVGEASIYIHI